MDIFQIIVLGIVEGVTEFLPISSTGHMVLVSYVLGIPQTEFVKTFEIFIQLGAIAAVGLEFFKRFSKEKEIVKRVIITFTPTGILGFAVYQSVKEHLFGNVWVTVISLFLGGIALILAEKIMKVNPKKELSIKDLSWKKCVVIGCAQAVAIVPGVSRAAMTIVTGMFVGLSRVQATEFSFLVATPTLAAAAGLDLFKSGLTHTSDEWAILGTGFVVAFVTAWVTVKWLLKFVKSHSFVGFGIYRIILAGVYAILFLR